MSGATEILTGETAPQEIVDIAHRKTQGHRQFNIVSATPAFQTLVREMRPTMEEVLIHDKDGEHLIEIDYTGLVDVEEQMLQFIDTINAAGTAVEIVTQAGIQISGSNSYNYHIVEANAGEPFSWENLTPPFDETFMNDRYINPAVAHAQTQWHVWDYLKALCLLAARV